MMDSRNIYSFCTLMLLLALSTTTSWSLSTTYYDNVCPNALPTIRRVVEAAVKEEPRMGASLLRMHFHDCFVNGCDASILLDPTPTIDSEKLAAPNFRSVRGYEVIDQIKSAVDEACGRPVVSCADILTVAARDSVVALGGPSWSVRLGRRDSTTASKSKAETSLPSFLLDLPGLIKNFKKQGLNARDLVALSGGHTIGFAQCGAFMSRIFNDTNIDSKFAQVLRQSCPPPSTLVSFDATPDRFDVSYFTNLVKKEGLVHSDQALFNGVRTDRLVRTYSTNRQAFFSDFARSMIKMGNIKPLTGNKGQIRLDCKKVTDFNITL